MVTNERPLMEANSPFSLAAVGSVRLPICLHPKSCAGAMGMGFGFDFVLPNSTVHISLSLQSSFIQELAMV